MVTLAHARKRTRCRREVAGAHGPTARGPVLDDNRPHMRPIVITDGCRAATWVGGARVSQRVTRKPSRDTVGRPAVPLTLMRILCDALVFHVFAQTTRRASAVFAYVSTVATFTPSM